MAKRKNVKPPGKCIFSGHGGLTKEHIWSKWTYTLIPRVRGGVHTQMLTIKAPVDPHFKEVRETKDRPGSTNTIKIRAVCRDCNSGWMSALDDRAKPILTPLILGQPAVITAATASIISAWITMKLMVAEHARPDDVATPQAERTYLMERREAPLTWKIWIAHHDGGQRWRTGYLRYAACFGPYDPEATSPPVPPKNSLAKNTQSVCLGIGQLLFQAIHTNVPGLSFDLPAEARPHLRQIWPPPIRGCLWPPGTILHSDVVNIIANGMDNVGVHWVRTA